MSAAEWIIVASATLTAVIDLLLWAFDDSPRRNSASLRAALWAFCCVVLVVAA
jgi:hypothetical protein